MARLQEYVSDSTDSGYYLRGYDSDSNTTFQVGRVARQIIDWLKICPGERLPDDLLWKLYDLDLITTGGQTSIKEADFETDFIKPGDENGLTKEQAVRLRQFITDYDSIKSDTVKRLEVLVGETQYVEPEDDSIQFSDENMLSEIADDVNTRELLLDKAERIIDSYELGRESKDCIRKYPVPALTALSRMPNGYFEVTELELSRSKSTYTLYDEEMWNGEGMVETNWKLSDVRGTSGEHEFEAEFDVEAHYTDASVQTQINISNGDPGVFQLTTNWEEGVDLPHNSPIESRREGFRKHICDCLYRQFMSLPEYDYTGPGPFFEP